MRIGIFGHYGNANMGDEAIVQATLESLRRRIPDAELACFSINAADSENRHGVPSYPIRHFKRTLTAFPLDGEAPMPVSEFSGPSLTKSPPAGGLKATLKRFPPIRIAHETVTTILDGLRALPAEVGFLYRNYRLLKSFDLIMVTGSNQFLDNFGGLWGFPYTVLKWAAIARMAGCKLALVSLGAGPLEGRMSKRFCRWALRLSHHASYRDQPSRALIEGGGPAYIGKVYPDVASNIDLPTKAQDAEAETLTVGINPMPVFDNRYWHDADDNKYEAYLSKLTALVRHVQSRGHKAALFSTQRQDNNVIGDVLGRLTESERVDIDVYQPRTVDQLLKILAELDISVPTRFHGTVLSLRSGNPTLGICYHRKIGDLLTDVGLGEFQVQIEDFSVGQITSLLDRLVADRASARALIADADIRYVKLLDQQYDELAALLER